MKKRIISCILLIISLIILAISKLLLSKGNNLFIVVCLFIIGFLLLLYGLNMIISLIKAKNLISLLKGKKYEKVFSVSIFLIYIGIILNIFNIKIVGVPISILGLGLIFYSMEMEKEYKERKLTEKIKDKIEEETKKVSKKVNKAKKEYKNFKKDYKKKSRR